MAAKHYGTFSVLDYSEETSSWSFNFGAVTAVSIAGFLTAFGNLRTSLGNIITGTIKKEAWVGDSTVLSNVPPVDSNSQVELKFLLSYEGDTTKKVFHSEIPSPDTTKLIPGTDEVDLTDVDVADFVTDFEAIARTPDSDTETVTVLGMHLVGRNN
jgi:hypothetical protein